MVVVGVAKVRFMDSFCVQLLGCSPAGFAYRTPTAHAAFEAGSR